MIKVTTQLTIGCGCGFVARTGKEAAEHCSTTGHCLSVNGTVRREEVPDPPARARKEVAK